MMNKPDALLDEHLEYLDELRERATVNMVGAAPYLKREYPELNMVEAREIHLYWIHTFGERHPEPEEQDHEH